MTHIWSLDAWKNHIDMSRAGYRSGLHLRFEKGTLPEIREFLMDFAGWLRKEYFFPLCVNVYIKNARHIKAMDGDLVVGTIWRPVDYNTFPYIRLAVGDYAELVIERGREGAKWAILHTFAHELTHYFQHINNLNLTPIGEERQATIYAGYILDEYAGHYTKDDSVCSLSCDSETVK